MSHNFEGGIDMKFEEIYSVMKELADEGNKCFQNSVEMYESAPDEEKQEMQEWLEEEFSEYDPSLWSIRTCLLSMSFAI